MDRPETNENEKLYATDRDAAAGGRETWSVRSTKSESELKSDVGAADPSRDAAVRGGIQDVRSFKPSPKISDKDMARLEKHEFYRKYHLLPSHIQLNVGLLHLVFDTGQSLDMDGVEEAFVFWSKKGSRHSDSCCCRILPGTSFSSASYGSSSLNFVVVRPVGGIGIPLDEEESYVMLRDCYLFHGHEQVGCYHRVHSLSIRKASGVSFYVLNDSGENEKYVSCDEGTFIRADSGGLSIYHRHERSCRLLPIYEASYSTFCKGGHITCYYFIDEYQASRIMHSFFCERYQPRAIKPMFPDDETAYYSVDIDISDREALAFILFSNCFFGERGCLSYGIYGVPLDRYLPYMPYEGDQSTIANLFESSEEKAFHERIVLDAAEAFGFTSKDAVYGALEKHRLKTADAQRFLVSRAFSSLEPSYKRSEWLPTLFDFELSNRSALYPYLDAVKKERQRIKSKLAEEGKLNVKWKSELALYRFVKSKYGDAIYQYHAAWLGMQSLDVFIPSLSVALEYQGSQHYGPVEHFGGERGFVERRALDVRKRELCEKKGICLIEWPYTELLTQKRVEKTIAMVIESSIQRYVVGE